jgi:hypothetical protein
MDTAPLYFSLHVFWANRADYWNYDETDEMAAVLSFSSHALRLVLYIFFLDWLIWIAPPFLYTNIQYKYKDYKRRDYYATRATRAPTPVPDGEEQGGGCAHARACAK